MKPSRLFTFVAVALIVACSTYGADEPTIGSPDGGASSSGGGSSSGNASSSGGSSSGSNTSDGSVISDAADDGPTYNEACPPCSGTCIPSGCSGAGPNNACNKPYDVTAATTLIVFACPEGPTATLPNQPACGNGGPKHGALLRLGTAPSKWTVKASGTNPFAVGGDCNAITSGSCSSSQVIRDFNPLLTIWVGTSSTNIQSCVQISVELTPS
jgi:hypothetical protein